MWLNFLSIDASVALYTTAKTLQISYLNMYRFLCDTDWLDIVSCLINEGERKVKGKGLLFFAYDYFYVPDNVFCN